MFDCIFINKMCINTKDEEGGESNF